MIIKHVRESHTCRPDKDTWGLRNEIYYPYKEKTFINEREEERADLIRKIGFALSLTLSLTPVWPLLLPLTMLLLSSLLLLLLLSVQI